MIQQKPAGPVGVDLYVVCSYTSVSFLPDSDMEDETVSQKRLSADWLLLIIGIALLLVSNLSLAESRPEVLERIRPIGQVNVEGQAEPAAEAQAPTPAPADTPTTEESPAAKAEPAPAAAEQAAPAVTEQASAPAESDGAALYAAKGCPACHGVDGNTTTLPIYPKLAGQSAEYAFNQMKDIKSGARSGGQAMVMKGIITAVSEEEMRIIADWLSNL